MRTLGKNIKVDGNVPVKVSDMKDGEIRVVSQAIYGRVGNQILSISLGIFLPTTTTTTTTTTT